MTKLCHPAEMLEAARRGDPAVLDQMTRCYATRLLEVGRRRCRNREDAEDAVQDAWVSASNNLTQLREDGTVEGWLVRMVANACHRMRRGRKNDPALHGSDLDLAGTQPTPEQLAAQGELLEQLGAVLTELAPLDRLVFILAEGQGHTGPEIAAELGVTPQAVRSRLSRTRRVVRERLDRLPLAEEGRE